MANVSVADFEPASERGTDLVDSSSAMTNTLLVSHKMAPRSHWLASTPLLGVAAAGYAISDLFGSLLVVLATIAVFVIAIQIGVQRLHDIGWSGWLLLINIVPVVGSVFALLMVVMPGTNGANRYGPMPPPNSTAVKVLACLFLLVPLSGIIAAIAMPTLFSAYAP